jgi:predicted nucleotidyltransferase
MNEETIRQVAADLHPVFERYHVLKALVFGSLARGEPSRRSDLDLVVVLETTKRFLDRYDGILSDIQDVVHGRDVDLLLYTPEELAKISGRSFIRRILQEGIVIYESKREAISG